MLEGLIERVEAATGPDRELDCEIAIAAGAVPDDMERSFHPNVWRGIYDNRSWRAPEYSASLDAAMTLVPRGWIVEIRRYFNSDGEYVAAVWLTDSFTVERGCDDDEKVTVSARIVEQNQGVDPTPSAICAASLRARISS